MLIILFPKFSCYSLQHPNVKIKLNKPVIIPPSENIPTNATSQLIAQLVIGSGRAVLLRPKCLSIVSVTGDTTRPPRIELRKTGPMKPNSSIFITVLIKGCTFFSQSPVRNPEEPPIHMQAPILGMKPAAEERQIPPANEPISESLRLSLSPMIPVIEAVIILAAMQKQRFKGPSASLLEFGVVPPLSKSGQSMPVNGKVAKMKPTPMRIQQADLFVIEAFLLTPFLESARAGTMLKHAAKRQIQLVPQSSNTLVSGVTFCLSSESARMKVNVQPILNTILHPNISSSPILPIKVVNPSSSPQSRTMETRISMRLSFSYLPASAPYNPVLSSSPMRAKYHILSQIGAN